ncbi:hypothetical protein QQS21_005803 [Conoideocrella luteorostrata]|uniref:Glycosyl hydrolase family 43 protein n=1 Tax=Conoideocrella luteorostrata TaxID=1105319 RepID=A0AAJ0CRA3_9HYPO|nr:hypothetical protein QQS21_005803 [Conoideocrella luteorostrata]
MRCTIEHVIGALALVGASQASLQVIPGATWTSVNTGKHIQAHGAGVVEVSGTYYMIGEDKTNGSPFQNVNCYSSTNLVEWKFENALLSVSANGGDLGPNRVVERPKVIYNDKTHKYVMYLHIDDASYKEAKVGVATSDTVCGKYQYRGSFRPLGQQSRDMGLFRDDDGKGFLLTEDRPNGLRIDALSDDYLNVTKSVYLWSESIEAPAVWKKDGYYFMFGSRLTGWSTNDNVYSYAKSLAGPWSPWALFADKDSHTYNSQTNFILPFGNSAIYMGDRWHSDNLATSTYIWLPLEISGTTIHMTNRDAWIPDVKAKTWSAAPSSSKYEGESAALSKGAKAVSCSGCSGGKGVGWVGGPQDGSVSFSGVHSDVSTRTTVKVVFANGDAAQRFATVKVNGKSQSVGFLSTVDGQKTGSSILNCDLVAGSGNQITFEGLDGGYGPDIDYISVPSK